jgi:hypothetical protein
VTAGETVYFILTMSNNGLPIGNVRVSGPSSTFLANLTYLDCTENCVQPSVPLSFDGKRGFGVGVAFQMPAGSASIRIETEAGSYEISTSTMQSFEDADRSDTDAEFRPYADGRNSYPATAGANVLLSTLVLGSDGKRIPNAVIRWSALGGKNNQILFSSRKTSVDGGASATFRVGDDFLPNVFKAVTIDPYGRKGVAYFMAVRTDTSTSRQSAPTCLLENTNVRAFPGQTLSLSTKCDRGGLVFAWSDNAGSVIGTTSGIQYVVPATAASGTTIPITVTATGPYGPWQGRVNVSVEGSALTCVVQTIERTGGTAISGTTFGFGQPLSLRADCKGGGADRSYSWLIDGAPAANTDSLNVCLDASKTITLRVSSSGATQERTKQLDIVTNYSQKYARIQFFENASIPNTSTPHYFMTANRAEANAVRNGGAGPGWQQVGTEWGWTGETWVKGSGPVCRFYSPVVNSHFYTANAGECCSLRSGDTGWKFEELAFVAVSPANGTCPENLVPVLRAYNRGFDTRFRDTNHFYTTDPAAYQAKLAQGWAAEGVAFCVRAAQAIALDAQVLPVQVVNGSDTGGGDSDGAGGSSAGAGDGLREPKELGK